VSGNFFSITGSILSGPLDMLFFSLLIVRDRATGVKSVDSSDTSSCRTRRNCGSIPSSYVQTEQK
jgi:hypothetical protein